MKKLAAFLMLVFFITNSFSQSIERKLIGTAGNTAIAGGYQLSYSIGETAVTPSPSQSFAIPANTIMFSIGFQQPHVANVGGVVHHNNWVTAYPNPTSGWVRLEIHGDNFQRNTVKIYNALGMQVALKPFVMINGNMDLDVSNLASGSYIVAVTDDNLGNTVAIKLVKINK